MEYMHHGSEKTVADLVISPSPEQRAFNGRPTEEFKAEQEILLNKLFPGRNLLLDYISLDGKFHVVENGVPGVTESRPNKPLDAWLAEHGA